MIRQLLYRIVTTALSEKAEGSGGEREREAEKLLREPEARLADSSVLGERHLEGDIGR